MAEQDNIGFQDEQGEFDEGRFHAAEGIANANGQSEQFNDAKEKGLTWEFEGKEYAMFHANSTGYIGMPIVVQDRKVGIIHADFDWSGRKPKSEVFINHLRIDYTEVTNIETGESTSHSKSGSAQNCDLFKAIVQKGELIKIDRFGAESEPIPRDYKQMCALLPELQSDLIRNWLASFYIERYFGTEGEIELEELVGEIDTISFKCSIGDRNDPAHVLLVHFNSPPKKIRDSFLAKRVKRTRKTEGKNQEVLSQWDSELKLRYAKTHLQNVEGAFVTLNGIDTPIKEDDPNHDEMLKVFKDNFNPEWLMDLADALQGAFSMAGK